MKKKSNRVVINPLKVGY